jgi:hypothetical protein
LDTAPQRLTVNVYWAQLGLLSWRYTRIKTVEGQGVGVHIGQLYCQDVIPDALPVEQVNGSTPLAQLENSSKRNESDGSFEICTCGVPSPHTSPKLATYQSLSANWSVLPLTLTGVPGAIVPRLVAAPHEEPPPSLMQLTLKVAEMVLFESTVTLHVLPDTESQPEPQPAKTELESRGVAVSVSVESITYASLHAEADEFEYPQLMRVVPGMLELVTVPCPVPAIPMAAVSVRYTRVKLAVTLTGPARLGIVQVFPLGEGQLTQPEKAEVLSAVAVSTTFDDSANWAEQVEPALQPSIPIGVDEMLPPPGWVGGYVPGTELVTDTM